MDSSTTTPLPAQAHTPLYRVVLILIDGSKVEGFLPFDLALALEIERYSMLEPDVQDCEIIPVPETQR